MKSSIYSSIRAILRAAVLLGVSFVAASAQIGGPKDLKPKPSGGTTNAPKAPASVTDRFEKEGIRIDYTVKASGENPQGLVAGADAVVTFNVSDARTGQPLTGIRPNAWISARKSEQALTEGQCKEKIGTFMGGLLSARPDIDLNSYSLLTLNHDNTISVINPQISFSRTQLENLITLPGAGVDWALTRNGQFLYVTMPAQSAIAVVNTVTRKVVATLPTGDKTRPTRISLQPDGRFAWVGLDNSPLVAVIDTAANKISATVEVGAGLHNIAFTADGRFAYVTNSAADTVSAIDAEKFVKVADIPVGKTPVPVAYSSASRFLYVASINSASISIIDPAKQQVVRSIPVKRGVVALRFEPEGRFGFAVNQVESHVTVIDASTNAVVGSQDVVKAPDQITFTDRYGYVRGTGSEKFSLIELSGLLKGKLAAVDVTAGQKPASAMPEEIGVADMIVPTPEGNAAMIANAPDQMIYYYVEGMMAPMGSLSNYKRRPHAAMILDRSLAEIAPGVYSLPIKLKGAGLFDVPVLTGQPRIAHCFQLEVASSPDAENNAPAVALAVKALFDGQQVKSGQAAPLRFRIIDSVTGQPLKGLGDVQVLAFEPPGIWQQRQWAKEIGEGEYEVAQTFPRPGFYKVMVRVASRGVTFADLPSASVSVVSGMESIATDNKDN